MKNKKTLRVLANLCARLSVRRWNKIRILRVVFRKAYQSIGNFYIKNHCEQPAPGVNTYPWPYCDPNFANWKEDDRKESYTLITDPANFVIRRSTSYVAWKIFELTGRWPLERGESGKQFHAKYWLEFLELNGYNQIVDQPLPGCHYVGIVPNEGEFGQLYWFERLVRQDFACEVSTYESFHYTTATFFAPGIERTIWVEIC